MAQFVFLSKRTLNFLGSDSFFHKGTNGNWREMLGADELQQYEAAGDRELTHECRPWLKRGGPY